MNFIRYGMFDNRFDDYMAISLNTDMVNRYQGTRPLCSTWRITSSILRQFCAKMDAIFVKTFQIQNTRSRSIIKTCLSRTQLAHQLDDIGMLCGIFSAYLLSPECSQYFSYRYPEYPYTEIPYLLTLSLISTIRKYQIYKDSSRITLRRRQLHCRLHKLVNSKHWISL